MKKIILLSGLAILLFTSCERHVSDPDPLADFAVEYSLVIPGEVIFFTNYSIDADRYEWSFGDGGVSYAYEPTYDYQTEGIYRVRLAAYRGNKVDYAYIDIEVYETTLEVEVVEYATGVYVPNVEVTLFTDYYRYIDHYELSNEVGFSITNTDGVVVFKNMSTISYYIDAWNYSFNNFTLAWDDINFIKTAPLQHARHNIFTAYVDYSPSGKMSVKSTRMRVKSKKDGPVRSAKNLKLNRIKEK